jgi:outer membrane protein OmpA-like peptidoglycan-associated protein
MYAFKIAQIAFELGQSPQAALCTLFLLLNLMMYGGLAMNFSYSKSVKHILALALIGISPIVLAAQNAVQPPVKTYANSAASNNAASKWDIFVGFSYLSPYVTSDGFDNFDGTGIRYGAIGSVSRYFNKYAGVQFEGDYHNDNNENHPTSTDFEGGSGGLILRYPSAHFTPFIHALVGGESAGSFYYKNQWGLVATGGGGLDYNTPLFDHHLALRLFQADYQFNRQDNIADFNMLRLSAGAVIRIGSFAPPVPVALACSVNPESIFPSDPVTVTATAGNLDPKLRVVYSWSGDGVTGNGATATVSTATLAPGTHTVNAKVSEGKGDKIGLKPGEVASCLASFTVKAFEPPTISCSASPNAINPNESSTVTASGISPQNRPLTYSYMAQSGSISGNGATAVFSSVGATAGPVAITCNVADDKGSTATAVANITIAPAPVVVAEQPSPEQVRLEARLALHSVFFPTAQPRATKPEGGLVDSQQQILKTLAEDFKGYLAIKPDAHLILTGHADVRGTEEYNQALTERRVNRAKQFLVEQGIAEDRIQTQAVGKEQELSQDEVKDLIQSNPNLTDSERQRILNDLSTIVLAQNRRVDITLTTTGQQSVKLYPFNAEDSITLLDEKAAGSRKHTHTNTKHVHAKQ